MEVQKKLDTYSEEERLQLIQKISKLAIKYDIEEVTPVLVDTLSYIHRESKVVREIKTQLRIKDIILGDKGLQVEGFTKELKEEVINEINEKDIKLELTVKLGPGCPFSPIDKIKDIFTCQEVSIFHKPGQVFLIDFWAKWCPYCHAPMKENQRIMTEHAQKWGDKFRLICISGDPVVKVVAMWLKERGWDAPEHYHRATSKANEEWGVDGIPYIVLVDGTGTIAYVGHPHGRKDLVDDIEKMIKGEKIEVDDEQKFSEFTEKELKQINEEIKIFDEKAAQYHDSNLDNENLKKMGEAIMIMKKKIIYSKQSEKYLMSLQSKNLIMGPQPQLFQVRDDFENFVKSLKLQIDKQDSFLRIMMEQNSRDE